jgi:hypothetical protein
MAHTDYFQEIAAGSKGNTGSSAADADKGPWAAGLTIVAGDVYSHAKTGYGLSRYKAKTGHVSVAGSGGNEPEIATAWATYWEVYLIGGQDGAGSGNVTKSGTWATGDVLGAVDTGYGVKSLGQPGTVVAAALTALSTVTTTPVGSTHLIAVWNGSAWVLMSLDNLAKRSVPIWIGIGAMRIPTTANGEAAETVVMSTNKQSIGSGALGYDIKRYYDFDFVIPDYWDEAAISAKIVWRSAGTSSYGVRFGIQASCAGDGEAIDRAWGTAVEVTDYCVGTANYELETASMSFTPSNAGAGKHVVGRIYRDPTNAADTLDAEAAYIIGIILEIGVNAWSV